MVLKTIIMSIKLKKVIVKSHEQWEHNILIYCILNTELNIILLHWNKQHLESSIVQWGCRPLDENFHLVLVCSCFAMQICRRIEHWAINGLTLWHKNKPALAFEADICTRWKSIPVQWFSEPFFHLFLRILTIDIVVLMDVIDLSHQIIEFSKYRDDGYCKIMVLIWNLKDGVIETFSCPHRLKELRFQWQ